MTSLIDHKIDGILERDISRIIEEITYIDIRLAQLGDDEGDEAERIILKILRSHLVEELRQIAGFTGDYGYNARVDMEAVAGEAVVED